MKYLHLGGDTVVKKENVVAVCDLDNASYSAWTRDYLRRVQKEDRVITVTEELPRSVVICMENGEERVYLSILSSATLLKRWENEEFETDAGTL